MSWKAAEAETWGWSRSRVSGIGSMSRGAWLFLFLRRGVCCGIVWIWVFSLLESFWGCLSLCVNLCVRLCLWGLGFKREQWETRKGFGVFLGFYFLEGKDNFNLRGFSMVFTILLLPIYIYIFDRIYIKFLMLRKLKTGFLFSRLCVFFCDLQGFD